MKGILIVLIGGMLAFASLNTSAQINIDVKKKVTKQATQRANQRTDQLIDKGFDKLEEGVGSLFKKKKKEGNEASGSAEEQAPEENAAPANSPSPAPEAQPVPEEKPKPQLTWAKYDFVPGTEIIFEDDFKDEQNGEFPSRWDVTKGAIEVAELDGEKVVWFKLTNSNGPDAILPYLKNRTEDYLPEEFTFEMDVYFHADNQLNREYYIFLYDKKNQMKIMSPSKPIRIEYNRIHHNFIGDIYPGQTSRNYKEGWRHVAISFNKRALKGYLDDTRLLNIPNLEFNPTGIMISVHNVSGTGKAFIKNVRIAKGAVPLYDKFLSDGKFVTTGIKFDVNKATIKPESMGTINYVVKMMTDHPELKFSVEGHTDSDGEDAANLKLSEARAKSVLEAMVKLGISPDRLTSKGHGESKPMTGNDTPEGKSQNRRVEFVKF